MELPRHPQSTHKPAADQELQGGEVVIPGTAFESPQTGTRPSENGGGDGQDNTATQSPKHAAAVSKTEPSQK